MPDVGETSEAFNMEE